MNEFEFRAGSLPLFLSVPHAGTKLPPELAARMTDAGREIRDTDWFVDRLFDLPILAEGSRIVARASRYLVDLNRPPDNESLYPGQNTTSLCPTIQFDGTPLYPPHHEPSPDEIALRVEKYWRPYHDQLAAELRRLRETYPRVLLLDAHSIASQVPRLFEGTLPDFNFGTDRGRSCRPELTARLSEFARQNLTNYRHVLNGRFVGGYITRHYAQPTQGIETLQLELSQATYLNEGPGTWNSDRAESLQACLTRLIEALLDYLQS